MRQSFELDANEIYQQTHSELIFGVEIPLSARICMYKPQAPSGERPKVTMGSSIGQVVSTPTPYAGRQVDQVGGFEVPGYS
jgi:hypothetical protein